MTEISRLTETTLDPEIVTGLRAVMRRMPGAVALITTRDPTSDKPAGLTASAVIPVSMEPPSMLVAVNRNASAHAAIERSGRYCVNLLGIAQIALVGLFSSAEMRDKRFASEQWQYRDGLPYLPSACANVFCAVSAALVHGTHEMFIGDVIQVRTTIEKGVDPLGWIEGGFARLGKLD